MEKFIPYEKLSKKRRRALDTARRGSWGGLSPVTRRPEDPKAYKRKKTRIDFEEDDPGFLMRMGFVQKRMVTVVPFPGALSRLRSAPCIWAPCLTMERPSPVPPMRLEWLLSTR